MTDNPMTAPPKLEPSKFRKKPVVIEAVNWNGKVFSATPDWVIAALEKSPKKVGCVIRMGHEVHIFTLEGMMVANPGDWIIRGVKGELYPCKPDIFAATHEDARLSQPSAPGVDAEDGVLIHEVNYAIQHYATLKHLSPAHAAIATINAQSPKPTEHSGGEDYRCVVCDEPWPDGQAECSHSSCSGYRWDKNSVRHTPTTPPSGDERAAFEAWAVTEEGGRLDLKPERNYYTGEPFDYISVATRVSWRTWLARAKHTSGPHSPAPGLSEEESKTVETLRELITRPGLSYRHARAAMDAVAIISRLTAAEPKAQEGKDGSLAEDR